MVPLEKKESSGDVLHLLSVASPPNQKLIDPLRELAIAIVHSRYTHTVAQHIGLATNELVENASLYGTRSTDLEFDLFIELAQRALCVRVVNATIGSRAAQLSAALDRLHSTSPRSVVEEGLRTASRGMGRSQLGLARVAYETSMDISASISGARVSVTARHRV